MLRPVDRRARVAETAGNLRDAVAVMDQTAMVLCRDHKIPLRVYNMKTAGNLLRLMKGAKDIGTLVRS